MTIPSRKKNHIHSSLEHIRARLEPLPMHPLLMIPSRALTRFYLIGALLLFLLLCHDAALIKELGDLLVLGLELLLLLGLVFNIWLARRGEIQKGAWLLWVTLMLLVACHIPYNGGLTAIVALMPLPMIVLSFIPKKRDIVAISCLTYLLLGGLHLYVTMKGPPDFPAPFYEPRISMVSFSVLIITTLVITLLCAHINVSAMRDVSQGILEMEQAKNLVTEREREWRMASAQALAMQQTKSRFLANMSHELRTPLNAILGYSEMLTEEFEEDENLLIHCEDTQKINLSARQLLVMINDILDLSRHEADRMPVKPQQFTFKALIDETFQALQARAALHDALSLPSVELDPLCHDILLSCDPLLLQNLLLHWILAKSSCCTELKLRATLRPEHDGVRLELVGHLQDKSDLEGMSLDTTDDLYDALHELLVQALCQTLALSIEEESDSGWSLEVQGA